MVVPYIEEPVTLKPEWLMNLEIQTNCPHADVIDVM
jgi:hypothetical protein